MLLLLLACANETTCPDGSMTASEEGLVVTEGEHPDGWGREDCETCHSEAALHRHACTPSVDMEELRTRVEEDGYTSCVECHGENGVSP